MSSFSADQSVQARSHTKSICSSVGSLRKGRAGHIMASPHHSSPHSHSSDGDTEQCILSCSQNTETCRSRGVLVPISPSL